jgi:hypothetical protein
MIFYVVGAFVILIQWILGFYLVFASAERLIADISWMRLYIPEKGTRLYRLLLGFWRGIGVFVLLFSLFMIYMVFIYRP